MNSVKSYDDQSGIRLRKNYCHRTVTESRRKKYEPDFLERAWYLVQVTKLYRALWNEWDMIINLDREYHLNNEQKRNRLLNVLIAAIVIHNNNN